jgi:putative glutamine amidotransferase
MVRDDYRNEMSAGTIHPSQPHHDRSRPIVGITADVENNRYVISPHYARIVHEEGGLPIILPPIAADAALFVERCGGIILTGGDDPIMEHWGIVTHPKAKKIHPERQAFELALLDELDRRSRPALGVCLGMQLMGLHAGGTLDQYLPDSLPTAADHWDRKPHAIRGELGEGIVHSHHRQALTSAGRLRVVATAHDGVIEAIDDPDRPFYVGVQWHPERTNDETFGRAIIRKLIDTARTSKSA